MLSLGGVLAACASAAPPPAPIRPVGADVVLAWTIERGLYDGGLRRSTEVVIVRARDGKGSIEVQDFGVVYDGDAKPRAPVIRRRNLAAAELDDIRRKLDAMELPDTERRREAPTIVPWELWGICVPAGRAMQCGQLLAGEWNDVHGGPDLFSRLEALRQELASRLVP